ncbi:hypothetical protein PAXINDRAFT_157477 [Paxillus involutus ATCC 200175]|uniref:Uncharacterized protein n=1 Tax=Paxillus involutus ATCC 200175 TaxID=664439 RepID=A0A0C9TUL7_PAXIN|nr:hypothetical protein PAXINDRAFT_157477 [Paxillus involutus ATCC 200175]
MAGSDVNAPRRTCSNNATTHPGHIVLQAQQKCCTKAQKATDDKLEHEAIKLKEAAAVAGLKRLAGIQQEMEATEDKAVGHSAKGIRHCPHPVKRKQDPTVCIDSEDVNGQPDTEDDMPVMLAQPSATEDIGEVDDLELSDRDGDAEIENGTKEKCTGRKKVVKTSLKDSIAQTHAHLEAQTGGDPQTRTPNNPIRASLARVGNKKGNVAPGKLISSKKFTISGQVKNWILDVPALIQTLSVPATATSSRNSSSAQVPPSTTFSAFSSTSESKATLLVSSTPPLTTPKTKATSSASLAAPLTTNITSVNTPDNGLVGGFGDKDLDDTQEHKNAVCSHVKGKQPVKVPVQITMDIGQPKSSSGVKCKLAAAEELAIIVPETDKCPPSIQVKVETVPVSLHKTQYIHSPNNFVATKLPPAKRVKKEKPATVLVPDSEVSVSEEDNALNGSTSIHRGTLTPGVASNGYWVEKMFKARTGYHNSDLPSACQDQRWSKNFVLMVLLWSSFPHSEESSRLFTWRFNIVSMLMVQFLVFNLDSTALVIMNNFFTRNKDIPTNELATALKTKCAFVYQDINNPVKEEAFWSMFVLQLLANVHLHTIIRHVNVPTLNTDKIVLSGITGALAASCAAARDDSGLWTITSMAQNVLKHSADGIEKSTDDGGSVDFEMDEHALLW